MITGVYKIVNKITNKIYVGSATDIKKRWRDHKWHLNHNKHHNSHLQLSWNRYGADAFEFLLILECSVDKLLIIEKEYIDKYNCFNNKFGYNINDPEHVFLNRKHSEETKQKLSIQKLGDKNPMYGKCGDKHPNYNFSPSTETRNKISLSLTGRPTNRRNGAKLTSEKVVEIRKMYNVRNISQPKIAIFFNVSQSVINSVINRRSWKDVP